VYGQANGVEGFYGVSATIPQESNVVVNSGVATDDNSSSGLSGGAIAGIVIGTMAGIALFVGLAYFFMMNFGSVNNTSRPTSEKTTTATAGTPAAPGGTAAVATPVTEMKTMNFMSSGKKVKEGDATKAHEEDM
jgi:hypothetical protein